MTTKPRLAVSFEIASFWEAYYGMGQCDSAASSAGLFPAGSARSGAAVTAGIYSGTSVGGKSDGGGPAELGCCCLCCPPATGLAPFRFGMIVGDEHDG